MSSSMKPLAFLDKRLLSFVFLAEIGVETRLFRFVDETGTSTALPPFLGVFFGVGCLGNFVCT